MASYRWRTPARKGRWLPTRQEALDAAVKAGEASRDEHSGKVFKGPLLEIEERGDVQ